MRHRRSVVAVGFESQSEQIEWSHAAPPRRASDGVMGARLKNEPMAATLADRLFSSLSSPSLHPSLRFLQFNKLPL